MIYDLIGTIYKPSGVMLTDEEGNEYPEMVALADDSGNPYYHVNVLEVTDDLLPYVVTPTSQVRVFAGRDDTVCLKFKDRAEWLALGYENVEEI